MTERAATTRTVHRRGIKHALGALGAAAVMLVAGCTPGGEADPTPTATSPTSEAPTTAPPTESPSLSPQDQDIAEAKATYEAYLAADNAVQKAAMAGWQDQVMPFITGADLRALRQSYFEQAEQQGLRQTGDTVIVSMTATRYTPDPTNSGNQQVALDVCLDSTNVDVVDPTGKSVLADIGKRLIEEVVMQRQTAGSWKMSAQETKLDRPC